MNIITRMHAQRIVRAFPGLSVKTVSQPRPQAYFFPVKGARTYCIINKQRRAAWLLWTISLY